MNRRLQALFSAFLAIAPLATAYAANVELHFIYVGQGDCTLIKTDDGRKVLVDCGSTDDGDAEEIREYLLAQLGSEPELDVLVITHPDADHYNLVEAVLEGIEVHKVIYVGTPSEYQQVDFDTWLSNHTNRTRLRSGDFDPPDEPSERFGNGDVKFHILSADINESPSPTNSRSIVLRVSCGNFQTILTGDATFATENKILERYAPAFLDAELLKLGHHGSSTTSTSLEWLEAVRPEAAVASAGYNSAYEHPRRSVVELAAEFTIEAPPHTIRWGTKVSGHMRLRNRNNYGEAIYSTASNGNVVVMSNGENVVVGYQGGTAAFVVPHPVAPQPLQPNLARAFGRASLPAIGAREAELDALAQKIADSKPSLPIAVPFNSGENVELVTRDNISVVGKLELSDKRGWIRITESPSKRPAYVRESEVVIVKGTKK